MPGIAFDRATSFYDATRGLPPGVAEQVRDQIALCTGAGHDTRFLDIGIGTGRIALPFVQIGADYTGADLSLSMMEVLRKKVAGSPKGRCGSSWRSPTPRPCRLPMPAST